MAMASPTYVFDPASRNPETLQDSQKRRRLSGKDHKSGQDHSTARDPRGVNPWASMGVELP